MSVMVNQLNGFGARQRIPTTIAKSSIVGWWDFDEGTGTSLADKSGNGHTATASSTSWVTTGGPAMNPFGLDFVPASDSYVDYGFDPFSDDGSIICWFTMDAVSAAIQMLFGKGNVGGDWDLMINTAEQLRGQSRIGGTDRQAIGATTLSTGTLYMAGYTWQSSLSSDQVWVSLNGVLDGSNSGAWGALSNVAQNIVSGRRSPGSATLEFDGKIFQTALFSQYLSATDHLALYNNGAGGKYEDFIFI